MRAPESGFVFPNSAMKTPPSLRLADVEAARGRLATGLRLTPCLIAPALSEIAGMRIWLKRDDLQRTGSFKERGARHALLRLLVAVSTRAVDEPMIGEPCHLLVFRVALERGLVR